MASCQLRPAFATRLFQIRLYFPEKKKKKGLKKITLDFQSFLDFAISNKRYGLILLQF